ncbi:unnamed protein product [Ceutorhynchus assimilis]|uniref:Uncharacterized protein n=1 Tax=Ceutorhynchus assimilis TaxID=467358 RepID=A0A9N9MN37_9CUCU|nr:unnamed protein product [Ceutorhynchus assimilis]
MRKLVILALVAFVCLNIKATSAALSCYVCRSKKASDCDITKADPTTCPDGYPYCIAFVGVNSSNETIYFRNCFSGDCDVERKSEPNVELKQCNACQKPMCNDDAFESGLPAKL